MEIITSAPRAEGLPNRPWISLCEALSWLAFGKARSEKFYRRFHRMFEKYPALPGIVHQDLVLRAMREGKVRGRGIRGGQDSRVTEEFLRDEVTLHPPSDSLYVYSMTPMS